jgi:hypothetical protein
VSFTLAIPPLPTDTFIVPLNDIPVLNTNPPAPPPPPLSFPPPPPPPTIKISQRRFSVVVKV